MRHPSPDPFPDQAPCVTNAAVFQHELLDCPPSARDRPERQAEARRLAATAERLCGQCPLQPTCLYDAVVKHDVSGFCAGTTAAQRAAIRRALGVSLPEEQLDRMAGVAGSNRPVDHEEVLRLRAANPHESLETTAMRLGCSLSTVKRHLRRARATGPAGRPAVVAPPLTQVLATYQAIRQPTSRADQRVA